MALLRLLSEVARSTILTVDNFQPGILLEITHWSAHPLAIRHYSNGAMPRSRKSSFSVEQAHCYFMLARGLMNRKAQVVWKCGFDRPRESLREIVSKSNYGNYDVTAI